MPWLGVRCWRDKIALALVDDDPDGPRLVRQLRDRAPATDDDGELALWFCRMTRDAIDAWQPVGIAVRISDATPEQTRALHEGAVLVAAAERGLPTQVLRRSNMVNLLDASNGPGGWTMFQRNDPFVGGLVADLRDAGMASLVASRRD